MRNIHFTAACMLSFSLAGCPGEITNPEDFIGDTNNVIGDNQTDAGKGGGTNNGSDAGTPPKDAGNGGGTDAGGGGNGGGTDAGGNPVQASCDFNALMTAKCGSSGCHGGQAGELATGLDLTSANLASRVEGQNGSNGCADYKMIDTEKPDQSALYLIVTNKPCGVRMPIGGAMSEAEQQCVLTWIQSLQ
jgi:hypothetical protein